MSVGGSNGTEDAHESCAVVVLTLETMIASPRIPSSYKWSVLKFHRHERKVIPVEQCIHSIVAVPHPKHKQLAK